MDYNCSVSIFINSINISQSTSIWTNIFLAKEGEKWWDLLSKRARKSLEATGIISQFEKIFALKTEKHE